LFARFPLPEDKPTEQESAMRTYGFQATRPIALFLAAALVGCGGGGDGGTTTPTGSISIGLSASTLSVAQGQNGSVLVTLTRSGGFADAVSLTLENAPAGVTGSFSPASLTGGALTSTLTVNAATTAATATTSVTIRATGTGISAQTLPLSLTITTAPTGGYTLALSSTTLNLVPGTSGNVTVNVNRTAPFTGAVSVAASGAPANVTVTPNPLSITGASGQLSISVAAGVAAGSYPITLRGTATGATDQTLTLTLAVASTSGGTAITLTYCQADPPIWVASQSESGPWIRAAAGATANTYTINISNRGGFAAVYNASGGGYRIEITYGTATELSTTGPQCSDATGSKAVTGTVASLAAADEAYISLGAAEAVRNGPGAFTITDVADGPLDLLAMRSTTTQTTITPTKLIFRRGVNQAANSAIPLLDFAATEAFDPVTANLTIGNLGTDTPFLLVSMLTLAGGTGTYYIGDLAATSATQPWYGLPESKLIAGDLHNAVSFGVNAIGDQFRAVYLYARQVTNRTVTLGPSVSVPTISVAGTTPYVRHRVVFARQTEYGQALLVQFSQNSQNGGPNYRSVSVQATSGYFGAAPTSWDVTVPDLSGGSGFLPTWGLQPGVTAAYTIGGIGATGDINAYPTDGLTLSFAFRAGNTASSEFAGVRADDWRAWARRLPSLWLRRDRR
jgi:hypothetical protein